jgi:hypothetical protein
LPSNPSAHGEWFVPAEENHRECIETSSWDRLAMCVCIVSKSKSEPQKNLCGVGLCKNIFCYRRNEKSNDSCAKDEYNRWESHRHVAQRALDLNVFSVTDEQVPAILILEDNVEFVSKTNTLDIDRIFAQMDDRDWDIIMLGHSPNLFSVTYPIGILDWNLWKTSNTNFNAYLLSERGARILTATPYQRFECGSVFRELSLEQWANRSLTSYALVPSFTTTCDASRTAQLVDMITMVVSFLLLCMLSFLVCHLGLRLIAFALLRDVSASQQSET